MNMPKQHLKLIKQFHQSLPYRNYSSELCGLDSSSISSLLLQISSRNKPLNCYSVVYEGLSYDELQYSDEFFYMNEVIKLGTLIT